jgi:hypothetical protein
VFADLLDLLGPFLAHPLTRALSIVFSAASLMVSLWVAKKTKLAFDQGFRSTHYVALDQAHADILKLAITHPHLRQPEGVKTAEQKQQYDSYALMVFNLLETIYDHCRDDPLLRETWKPIVTAESHLHRSWFEDPENRRYHKQTFRQEMLRHFQLAPASSQGAASV